MLTALTLASRSWHLQPVLEVGGNICAASASALSSPIPIHTRSSHCYHSCTFPILPLPFMSALHSQCTYITCFHRTGPTASYVRRPLSRQFSSLSDYDRKAGWLVQICVRKTVRPHRILMIILGWEVFAKLSLWERIRAG